MPTIPKGLRPVVEGYAVGAPTGVLRTPVAGGLARYGMDWDRGLQQYRLTMILDEVQLSVWTAFLHHIVKDGALAFDMPMDSGMGQQVHSVTIVPGSITSARRGTATAVSFAVVAQSAAYGITEAAAIALIAAYNGYAAPAGIPPIPRGMKVVSEGYSFDGPTNTFGSEVPGGLPRAARPWERGSQTFRITMCLEADAFKIWTLWLHHALKKGTYPFALPLDSGFGAELHTVTMIPDTCTATRNGALWIVSFGVEAEPSVYGMSAATAQVLIDLYEQYGSEGAALLQRLDRFANQDILVLQ